jgi:glycosyltransferase involved in cell wall biosynthesis
VICIPYLKSGGGERVAANLANAFSHLYGPESVAVLVTDWSGFVVSVIFPENVRNSYPQGVPIVDIAALNRMRKERRAWDLMTALMSMRPELVVNVNSSAMWDCYGRFAPELSQHMRLGTVAFGQVGDKAGKPIGYLATHLERLLPFLDFVITDHTGIIEDLRYRFSTAPRTERVATEMEWSTAQLLKAMVTGAKGEADDISWYLAHLPGRAEGEIGRPLARETPAGGLDTHDVAKFHCLYQHTAPAARRPAVPARSSQGRPQILWASRVTRVKFPELLPHIAGLLPECDIHAFGAREIGYRFPTVKNLLLPGSDLGDRLQKAPNLHWRGPYRKFGDLPLERFSALLYTSLYDGLPNVLIEAGAHGIPIIAPTGVGGIGELIGEATGWPIENHYDAREYADRVRDVLASPEEAAARAEALSDLVATRHSFEAFCTAVRTLVEAKPPKPHVAREASAAKHGNGAVKAYS